MLPLLWIYIKRSWVFWGLSLLAAAARIFMGSPEGPFQSAMYEYTYRKADALVALNDEVNKSRKMHTPEPIWMSMFNRSQEA